MLTSTDQRSVSQDRAHVLHGFSPLQPGNSGPIFASGSGGTHLVDVDGQLWLDAAGGQANVALGYGRTDIPDAVASALKQLSYGTHFYHSRGHVFSSELGERLAGVTPAGIDHFFYTVGGSDAVETIIRLIRYTNVKAGQPSKQHIIGRWDSYHGVSYAAGSLTGNAALWDQLVTTLPGFSHIPQPSSSDTNAAEALEQEILRLGPENVAAFMAEPISTPNGIVAPPEGYWQAIREICDRYDVLLVLDEVLTGFGRTGQMFGADLFGVVPDLMTISKAMTAGLFPLGAVGVGDRMLKKLSSIDVPFIHGFTGGGHPGACAAAVKTLDIFEEEKVLDQCRTGSAYFLKRLHDLAHQSDAISVPSVRGIGMMLAFDFNPETVNENFGRKFHKIAVEERLLLRTYRGDQTVGFLPALVTSSVEVDEIIGRLETTLERTVESTDPK
jgi:adenosylmethionine-8-amino-7-oxononanoate aminotransferase